MRPVRTGAANFVYRGPTPEIGDLWVQRIRPGEVRAVFELDDDERKLIAEGGRVELAILYEPMPPISLAVLPEGMCRPVGEHPWKIAAELEDEARRPANAAPPLGSSRLTTDPADPRLGHGPNDEPVPQNAAYLVLSEEDRAQGFVRPYRASYQHIVCGSITTMGRAIAETYARQPTFYGATYCVHCSKHRPLSEFVWVADDGSVTDQVVGS